MKMKLFAGTGLAALMLAGTASAQVVAQSFDNLVDQVLADTNAAMFAGAVNTAEVDGSINITAGAILPPGAQNISESFESVSLSNAQDGSIPAENSSEDRELGSFSAAISVGEVTQDFGEVATLAAGAVNDAEFNLNETGATSAASAEAFTSNTGINAAADALQGSDIGIVTGALNTADIDGSVSMATPNASVIAEGVGTTAAGAISTSSITASFVGGEAPDSDANINP